MKISIYAPYAKERFETARQHSILHPERIVGNSYPWDFLLRVHAKTSDDALRAQLPFSGLRSH